MKPIVSLSRPLLRTPAPPRSAPLVIDLAATSSHRSSPDRRTDDVPTKPPLSTPSALTHRPGDYHPSPYLFRLLVVGMAATSPSGVNHQPQINRNLFIAVASKGSVWLWRGSPETFIRPYLLPLPTPASTPRPLSGPHVPCPSPSPLRLKFPQINSGLPLLHRIYNKLPPGRTHGGNLMGSYDRHISRSSTQNYLPRQRSGRGAEAMPWGRMWGQDGWAEDSSSREIRGVRRTRGIRGR